MSPQPASKTAARPVSAPVPAATMSRRLAQRIERLVGKEPARVFTPAVTREACLQGESESFANRFFKGARGALLVHFAESTKLSDKELKELEDIIKQKKKGGRRGN